uniref:Uncharacterized protein n=1 Tax=Anguilla anguilla TaxID=7936 RepID=A0A0E9XDJ0_ANGAN
MHAFHTALLKVFNSSFAVIIYLSDTRSC